MVNLQEMAPAQSAAKILDRLRSRLEPLLNTKRADDAVFYFSFLILSLLLISPIWEVYYLPLGDLPDHAAQMKVILNYSHYKDDYYINWFTPYLVGYVIALCFALIFPVPVALKLALSIALICVPLASLYLLRNLQGNRYWVWICFPIAHGFSFYWGFYSYIVATPIAITLIAYTVSYAKESAGNGSFARAALFSALLFLSHAMAWVMTMALVACILWIGRSCKEAGRKFFPFVLIIPLVVYWAANVGPEVNNPVAPVGHYSEHYWNRFLREATYIYEQWQFRTENGEHTKRFKELFSYAIGKQAAPDYVLISMLLAIWPLFSGAKIRMNPKWWLPGLSVIAAVMVIPYWIFDTSYVNLRFAVFLFPALFFLYRYQPSGAPGSILGEFPLKKFIAHGVAFFVVVLLLLGVNRMFDSFKDNDVAFAKVLAEMESDRKVLTLVFDHDSPFQFSPPYLHFGSWYQSVKGGVELMSFSHDSGAQNVPVRYRHQTWPIPSGWNPGEFQWGKHEGARYDYFLVRSKSDRAASLFREDAGKVVLAAHHGDWYLYKTLAGH